MAKKVDVDKLFAAIADELNEYAKDVNEQVNKAKLKRANQGVKKLKATSPVGETGVYAKGWRRTIRGNTIIIHNATRYQLAHLLEFGHAKKGGGRVAGKPHIRPVEEEIVKGFIEDAEKAVRGQ